MPPSGSVPAPPVEAREQLLPFGQLAWEDFERLCLRLARREADVECCQFYGTAGQQQHGIDLLATCHDDGTHRVYQCKRERGFSAAKIRYAVSRFLEGSWAMRARTLVLCTEEVLRATGRVEQIELERARLAAMAVGLVIWDAEALSMQLKSHADLVDDFFGRVWVTRFLGEATANGLSRRLDRERRGELRRQLSNRT